MRQGASWDSSRCSAVACAVINQSKFSCDSSFATSNETIIPLKPISLIAERQTIQNCLTILFSSPSVTRFQPWDSYIFPPEVVELVFLDVKACAGDVHAATSLVAKSELAKKHSNLFRFNFFNRDLAVFKILPSSPQLFDVDDVSFVNVEIRGISCLTINVFSIE